VTSGGAYAGSFASALTLLLAPLDACANASFAAALQGAVAEGVGPEVLLPADVRVLACGEQAASALRLGSLPLPSPPPLPLSPPRPAVAASAGVYGALAVSFSVAGRGAEPALSARLGAMQAALQSSVLSGAFEARLSALCARLGCLRPGEALAVQAGSFSSSAVQTYASTYAPTPAPAAPSAAPSGGGSGRGNMLPADELTIVVVASFVGVCVIVCAVLGLRACCAGKGRGQGAEPSVLASTPVVVPASVATSKAEASGVELSQS
jgi:hypothetical protein